MNEDILKGQWTQIRGQVKQWWGMLTDDDLNKINGKRDQLIGKLQERYGYSKEQAVKQLDERLAEFQRMMAAPHH
ncbi:MAG: CsbD family protein [Anaerolineae bacterium]